MTLEDGKEALIIAQKNALYEHQKKAYQFGVDIISQIMADAKRSENQKAAISRAIEQTKEVTAKKTYKEKTCEICGKVFIPTSAKQKICEDCKSKRV